MIFLKMSIDVYGTMHGHAVPGNQIMITEAQMESENLDKLRSLLKVKVVSYQPQGLIVNQRFNLWLEYLESKP